MKSVAVLLIMLVLVAGVAVNGSRAQPLPETSVAFRACQYTGRLVTETCQPLIGVAHQFPEDADTLAGLTAFDVGIDDIGRHWVDLITRLLQAAAREFADWYLSHFIGPVPTPGTAAVDLEIFDPSN